VTAIRPTLQTVANLVGVSRATVSNAFSRPDQLSAALRERILAVAEDVGYPGPDPAARGLARGTTGVVGVVLSESLRHAFTDEVLTAFLGGVADSLGPAGLAVTLLAPGDHGHVVPTRDVAMDGALVCAVDPESEAVRWLVRRGVPLVLVDDAPVEGVSSVNVDDHAGARLAAHHLVELGHRHIGVLTVGLGQESRLVPDPSVADVVGHTPRERLAGWLGVLRQAGVSATVVNQSFGYRSAATSARLLLDSEAPPTGVVCFSDAMAAQLVGTAEELGGRVPDDLSVVGFDDSSLARRSRPALTTVRQDIDAKGRAAAAALETAIEHRRAGRGVVTTRVLLPTELVVRESTAAATTESPQRAQPTKMTPETR